MLLSVVYVFLYSPLHNYQRLSAQMEGVPRGVESGGALWQSMPEAVDLRFATRQGGDWCTIVGASTGNQRMKTRTPLCGSQTHLPFETLQLSRITQSLKLRTCY